MDAGIAQRLTARFGSAVEPWLDELPGVLGALASRWRFELGPAIPRGSMSAVFHCRLLDGRPAVVKVSPDRGRVAVETAALRSWDTVHAPAVLAHDEKLRAILLEAIQPGTPLVLSTYPSLDDVASSVVLLHGDLTPSNILDGGPSRGLVAIDPAPCLGDAEFDAVDLILWRAEDVETINVRIERLAAATGLDASRLLAWCSAFAAMNALELASEGHTGPVVETLMTLATRPPGVDVD